MTAKHVAIADPELHLADDGTLTAKNSTVTKGQGIRLCHQPAGKKGTIGLAKGWTTPGCRTPVDKKLPPGRFAGPIFVVNAVVEEYVDIGRDGCDMKQQAMLVQDGRRLDVLTITCDGKTAKRKYDIERCFAEYAVTW